MGALGVLRRGAAVEVNRWADSFRVDPDNRYVRRLLVRLSVFGEKTLRELSVGAFFYSALFLTSAASQARGRVLYNDRYVLLIPLELYELTRRATFAKGIVLVLNLAVIIYLVVDLRRSH